MTTATQTPDLDRLGDALEHAARRDLQASRRRTVRLALAALAVCALAAGTAAAAGVFSADDVAKGMPAGSAIFGGTEPSCTLDDDGVTYHCTLSSPPAPEIDDFLGTKELVTLDGRIAGGCIGRDDAGMTWDCYLGDEAVARQILVHDLLGQPSLAPSRG
jgi:hypothetical protein